MREHEMSMEELAGYRENLLRMGRRNPAIVQNQIRKLDREMGIRRAKDKVHAASGAFAWALIIAGGVFACVVGGC